MDDGLCPFGRAVLAGEAGCTLARRRPRGEHEAILCASEPARTHCSSLFTLLRERARFALKLPAGEVPIPHVQMMRLQCGGARAIAAAMGETAPRDLHELVADARARWGSLGEAPFGEMIASLVAWQPRRRSTPPRA